MTQSNGGDVHIKAGDGGIHGPGGNIEINGGVAGVTIKGGDGGSVTNYPGGPTWVDKAFDPNFKQRTTELTAETENVVAQVNSPQQEKPSPEHWYKKPIAVISFSVIAGVILLCLRYIAIHYLGLSL